MRNDAARECTRISLEPGDPAPDFHINTDAGGVRTLTALRGAPVVLLFHAPHWDPSRREHLELFNRLIENAPGGLGAKLLTISGTGACRRLEFNDDALAMSLIADSGPDIAAAYGVDADSAVFVIDAAGIIRWRFVTSDASIPPASEVVRAIQSSVTHTGIGDAPASWTRRQFVATVVGAAFAMGLGARLASGSTTVTSHTAPPPVADPRETFSLSVNGRDIAMNVESRVTLLDALREYAGLTGTKKGCDHGQCGACTVHADGRRVLSCLTLAHMAQGKRITTIEGLAATTTAVDGLHPLQRAFITHDGFQCGYCTPGQIMSAAAMLSEPWGPGDDDVREAMSGNICRCGAYPGILAAVQEVRARRPS